MVKAVEKVKQIIGDSFSSTQIRNMLNKYHWDTERFLEEFYLKESGVTTLQERTTQLLDVVKKENKDPGKAKKTKKPVDTDSTTRITRSQARNLNKRDLNVSLASQESSGEPPRKIRVSALLPQNTSDTTCKAVSVPTCEICFDSLDQKVNFKN